MFFKGLFDKFGVKADISRSVSSKGADESYTRTELSPESKGELDRLADGLYTVIVETWPTAATSRRQTVKSIHR